MIRLYRIPHSTNVERVALALAHKGLQVQVESVWIDPADRGEVRRVSGQDLVPVLEIDGEVLIESMDIVRELERRVPSPPLYPREPAPLAETLVFIEWFDRVWKVPPNAIEAELRKPQPDRARIEELSGRMRCRLGLFEDLLRGRDHLLGDGFSAADVCAFPFLKYAVIWPEGDDELFHEILRDHQRLDGRYPGLEAWIRRVDGRPRA